MAAILPSCTTRRVSRIVPPRPSSAVPTAITTRGGGAGCAAAAAIRTQAARTRIPESYRSVVETDDAVLVGLRRLQRQRHGAPGRRQERDPLADERRDHVHDEIVDLSGIQERGDN